jgi:hypothetical protein
MAPWPFAQGRGKGDGWSILDDRLPDTSDRIDFVDASSFRAGSNRTLLPLLMVVFGPVLRHHFGKIEKKPIVSQLAAKYGLNRRPR